MNDLTQKIPKTNAMILIVDDISKNLEVLGSILRENNYFISVAMSGKQALTIVNKRKPDLILLDIQMPEMDGFEVCKNLKSNPDTLSIPIIFLTAKTETEDIVKGFELGAVDYITKPFSPYELLARVKTHIDLKKSKDLIQSQANELQELNISKDKLFSVVAHDLRGPIGSLLSSLEMLTMDKDFVNFINPDEFFSDLRKSTDSVYTLLDNLLNWARSQMDTQKISISTNNISALIDDTLKVFSTILKNKKIDIIKNYPEKIEAKFDKETMSIVFRNLISNALKFTHRNGTIKIDIGESKENVQVSIADNGIGIKNEVMKKLFVIKENFTSRGTGNEKGSGLGLILVKEFLQKNDGQISVESELGVGTKFTIQLKK